MVPGRCWAADLGVWVAGCSCGPRDAGLPAWPVQGAGPREEVMRRVTVAHTWVPGQALDPPVSQISLELCTDRGVGRRRERPARGWPDAPSERDHSRCTDLRPFLSPTRGCRLRAECLDLIDGTCVFPSLCCCFILSHRFPFKTYVT